MVCELLIVEDFEPFRRFVCSTLQKRAELHIAEASDGLEALQKIEQLQPNLVILDLNLPKLNGIEVCKCARKLVPSAKILFLSQEFSADLVEEALRVGAHGYVHKMQVLRDLTSAIAAVQKGKGFVSGRLSAPRLTKERELEQSVPSSLATPYAWQRTVADALKAPVASLPARVNIAERAIAARLVEPNQTTDELHALRRALRSLAVLVAETKPQVEGQKKKEDTA